MSTEHFLWWMCYIVGERVGILLLKCCEWIEVLVIDLNTLPKSFNSPIPIRVFGVIAGARLLKGKTLVDTTQQTIQS